MRRPLALFFLCGTLFAAPITDREGLRCRVEFPGEKAVFLEVTFPTKEGAPYAVVLWNEPPGAEPEAMGEWSGRGKMSHRREMNGKLELTNRSTSNVEGSLTVAEPPRRNGRSAEGVLRLGTFEYAILGCGFLPF